MQEISNLLELQQIELDILKYVVDICESNSLRYFLAGGTLLGAIRHKGFIPWDNDVDISMPRPDYDKLINILNSNQKSYYQVLCINNTSDYFYPFAKVIDNRTILEEFQVSYQIKSMGVYIDIFPIDGFGNDRKKAERTIKSMKKWGNRISGMINPITPNTSFRWKIIRPILNLKYKKNGALGLLNSIEKKVSDYSFDTSELIGSTFGARVEKEIIEKEHFDSYILVDFDKYKFRAPIGYDQYLKQMYGDYMVLPPESDRSTCHNIKVYWRE